MRTYAADLLSKFDYNGYVCTELKEIPKADMTWIESFNAASLQKSQYNQNENENVTSIMINYPALLLRKKSQLYPEGRTSYRFKRELRKKVTIHGKTMFGKNPEAAKMAKMFSEVDQPEVD